MVFQTLNLLDLVVKYKKKTLRSYIAKDQKIHGQSLIKNRTKFFLNGTNLKETNVERTRLRPLFTNVERTIQVMALVNKRGTNYPAHCPG